MYSYYTPEIIDRSLDIKLERSQLRLGKSQAIYQLKTQFEGQCQVGGSLRGIIKKKQGKK